MALEKTAKRVVLVPLGIPRNTTLRSRNFRRLLDASENYKFSMSNISKTIAGASGGNHSNSKPNSQTTRKCKKYKKEAKVKAIKAI